MSFNENHRLRQKHKEHGIYSDSEYRECLEESLNWMASIGMIHVCQVDPFFEEISGYQIFDDDGLVFARQLEEIDTGQSLHESGFTTKDFNQILFELKSTT